MRSPGVLVALALGALLIWSAVALRSRDGAAVVATATPPLRASGAGTESTGPEARAYADDSVFRPESDRHAQPPPPPPSALPAQLALTASDARPFSYFGQAVAISGDLAIIGAPYDDRDAIDAGATYVFRRGPGGWRQEARLAAPAARPFDRFGFAVAAGDDTVMVGADRADRGGRQDCGTAFVFRRAAGDWTLEAELTPAELSAGDGFGLAVALDGDLAAVGAPGRNALEPGGSVFVFRRAAGRWTLEAELHAPTPVPGAQFGHAVALSGNTLVAGAPTADGRGVFAGEAWVFRRGPELWRSEGALVPADAVPLAKLGAAVAVDGERVLVGAPRSPAGERTRAGAAHLFERRGGRWQEIARLTAEEPRSDEEFGRAVALSGDLAAVASNFGDLRGLNTGVAYVFRRDATGEWRRVAPVLAADAAAIDEFGTAVAAAAGRLLIGAPRHAGAGNAAGAAYLVEIGG